MSVKRWEPDAGLKVITFNETGDGEWVEYKDYEALQTLYENCQRRRDLAQMIEMHLTGLNDMLMEQLNKLLNKGPTEGR